MALPTFTVGQVLTAADVNRYLKNTITAIKTANESVTSSTTLQDDNHLTASVEATSVYELECVVFYEADTGGDIKLQFSAPAGASLSAAISRLTTGAATIDNDAISIMTLGTAIPGGGLGAGQGAVLQIKGVVTIAGTAGTFKLQWAQNASSGTATTVYADSYFVLRQIS